MRRSVVMVVREVVPRVLAPCDGRRVDGAEGDDQKGDDDEDAQDAFSFANRFQLFYRLSLYPLARNLSMGIKWLLP